GFPAKCSWPASHRSAGIKTGLSSGISMDSPAAGRGTTTQSSLRIVPSAAITSGIYPLLERIQTDPAIAVQKGFLFRPVFHVNIDQLGDDLWHFLTSEGRPQNLADGGVVVRRSTQADLIELFAFLVDTQNTDVAHVMVATGVHAARNVEVDGAKVVQEVQVIKTTLDCFGHRNRLGVGQGAEIAARAA